jgi:hypothetical protein
VDHTLQGVGKEGPLSRDAVIDAGVAASEKWQLIDAMLSVLHSQHHRVVIVTQVCTSALSVKFCIILLGLN